MFAEDAKNHLFVLRGGVGGGLLNVITNQTVGQRSVVAMAISGCVRSVSACRGGEAEGGRLRIPPLISGVGPAWRGLTGPRSCGSVPGSTLLARLGTGVACKELWRRIKDTRQLQNVN